MLRVEYYEDLINSLFPPIEYFMRKQQIKYYTTVNFDFIPSLQNVRPSAFSIITFYNHDVVANDRLTVILVQRTSYF